MARPGPDPALVAAVIKAYTDTDATVSEIAEIAGVTPRTINRWLETENIPPRAHITKRAERQDNTK